MRISKRDELCLGLMEHLDSLNIELSSIGHDGGKGRSPITLFVYPKRKKDVKLIPITWNGAAVEVQAIGAINSCKVEIRTEIKKVPLVTEITEI